MYTNSFIKLSLATLAVSRVSAFDIGRVSAGAPHIEICYENEKPELHCYNGDGDVPQNVTVDDVTYIGKYLRAYGRQTKEGRLFTMTAQGAPDCAEWTLYARKSALALAKHIDSSKNSSVLFEDIATTIDGGPSAADPDKQKAIIGCLGSGGSLGVLINGANPAYSSDTYKKAGYTPDGILVKIVANA